MDKIRFFVILSYYLWLFNINVFLLEGVTEYFVNN